MIGSLDGARRRQRERKQQQNDPVLFKHKKAVSHSTITPALIVLIAILSGRTLCALRQFPEELGQRFPRLLMMRPKTPGNVPKNY
jgi:hypothetical protein